MAPPTAMAMSSAAAANTLSVRENRGGSGGGSLPTRTGMFSEVLAALSVALIVRSRRRVIFAVLVFVRLRLVAGYVQTRGSARLQARPHGQRDLLRLRRLFVPEPQACRPDENSFEAKGTVRARHAREVRVDDHDEAHHLGMDVAVDPHEPRLFELLLLGLAGPVEAEVE